jgi:hypothetical protein
MYDTESTKKKNISTRSNVKSPSIWTSVRKLEPENSPNLWELASLQFEYVY